MIKGYCSPRERATADGTHASGALRIAREKHARGVRTAVARFAGLALY